jgi:hypothetical protein
MTPMLLKGTGTRYRDLVRLPTPSSQLRVTPCQQHKVTHRAHRLIWRTRSSRRLLYPRKLHPVADGAATRVTTQWIPPLTPPATVMAQCQLLVARRGRTCRLPGQEAKPLSN